MSVTGDMQIRHGEMAALAVAVLVIVAVAVLAGGTLTTADNRPPCVGGNYVGGTCRPDESGAH